MKNYCKKHHTHFINVCVYCEIEKEERNRIIDLLLSKGEISATKYLK